MGRMGPMGRMAPEVQPKAFLPPLRFRLPNRLFGFVIVRGHSGLEEEPGEEEAQAKELAGRRISAQIC